MPVGDRRPVELLMDDEAWAREPVRLAEELGHAVVGDSGAQERWTCTWCGRAVVRVGCNIYGSAVTEPCPPALPVILIFIDEAAGPAARDDAEFASALFRAGRRSRRS